MNNFIKRISMLLALLVLSGNFSFALENEETFVANEIYMLEQSVEVIENELSKNGTDVISELNNMKNEYQGYLSSSEYSKEEKDQIQDIIDGLEDLIIEYKNSEQGIYQAGRYHPIYSRAVASVISYFNINDYRLASELLVHAKNNERYNSLYKPIHGRRVTSSPVFRKIFSSSAHFGSDKFPNEGTSQQRDLHYAINKFNWRKSGRNIVIEDRYDFAYGTYQGIKEIAVNTMYLAEKARVITPFFVRIVI